MRTPAWSAKTGPGVHGVGTPRGHLRALVKAPPLMWHGTLPLAADRAYGPMRLLLLLQWCYHSCSTDASMTYCQALSPKAQSIRRQAVPRIADIDENCRVHAQSNFRDETVMGDMELASP